MIISRLLSFLLKTREHPLSNSFLKPITSKNEKSSTQVKKVLEKVRRFQVGIQQSNVVSSSIKRKTASLRTGRKTKTAAVYNVKTTKELAGRKTFVLANSWIYFIPAPDLREILYRNTHAKISVLTVKLSFWPSSCGTNWKTRRKIFDICWEKSSSLFWKRVTKK